MSDLTTILQDFGVSSPSSAEGAVNTFFREYASLTGRPLESLISSPGQKSDIGQIVDGVAGLLGGGKWSSKPLIKLASDIIEQGTQTKDAVALGKVVPQLLKRLIPGDERSTLLEKVSRMLQAEGPSGFIRVNEYARIAAHVYGNRKDSILPRSWCCLGNTYRNIQLNDKKSGLQAALYRNNQSGSRQYVYAIAGTRGWDIKDWKANLGQIIGISDQYDRARETAEKLAKELGVPNLAIVGHSKGGGQAAYCALKTNCKAITFNPAGLGLYKFDHDDKSIPDINSYVIVNDVLNLMQMVAQLLNADITADGSVHYLKKNKTTPLLGHGIDDFLKIGSMTDTHHTTGAAETC